MSVRFSPKHVVFVFLLLSDLCVRAQKRTVTVPYNDQLIIGRDSFFDFGPPFNYYSIYVLDPNPSGTSIERIEVTPHGEACLQPAIVKDARAHTTQSMAELLGNKNPCNVPEKALKHEGRRSKHKLVFSGAEMTLQVKCRSINRLLNAEVFDRDFFEAHPGTPGYTADIYGLVTSLDSILGPNDWEKARFAISAAPTTQLDGNKELLNRIGAGEFDSLFPHATQKISEIYTESLKQQRPPTVSLLSSVPIQPKNANLPSYSAIGRAAHIEGLVQVEIAIGVDAGKNHVTAIAGSPFLVKSVISSANSWSFNQAQSGQFTKATVEFKLNCPIGAQ